MNIRTLITLILLSSFAMNLNGQMIEGHYPYQQIDTLFFDSNPSVFQIDLKRKADNRTIIAGISNYTSDTLSFPIQDESLIAIIEAKIDGDRWKPIQFWPVSGCGNSYYTRDLYPNNSIVFTVERDFGEVPADLRIRLHGNDTVYISKKYSGSIDTSMFIEPENIKERYKYILCDTVIYLNKPYFGKFNYDKIEFDTFE